MYVCMYVCMYVLYVEISVSNVCMYCSKYHTTLYTNAIYIYVM